MSVPLPAPDGPVITKTGVELPAGESLAVEECNELRALALRQPAHRLRLADAAEVEGARRLHRPGLGHRDEHVEALRRRDVLRRIEQDLLDRDPPVLEILLQLRPPDP